MDSSETKVRGEDIFSTQRKEVTVKGQTFFVHELDWAADAIDLKMDGNNGMLMLLIGSVKDAEGQPVWTAKDLPKLRTFSRVRLFELVKAALAVNGFNADDSDEKLPAQMSTQSSN